MKIRSCVQILLFFMIILIISNCNMDIDPPEQKPLIDSLYVIEQHEYNLGDTINVVCVTGLGVDSLQFEWHSIGGEIFARNDTATVISTEDSIVLVFCKVQDSTGSETTRSLTIKFDDKIFVNGHVEKHVFEDHSVMSNTPYTISYDDSVIHGMTDDEGNFIVEFSEIPDNFNILIDQDDFKVDTTISKWDLTQRSIKRYDINISAPGYIDFFPVSLGNTWTFNSWERSDSPGGSSRNITGVETWEIVNINASRDTIQLNVSFEGQGRYFIEYGQSDTTFIEQIDTTESVLLVKCERTYWPIPYNGETFSAISWCSVGNPYTPGMKLMLWGMPIIHEAKRIVDFIASERAWTFQYGVGPLFGLYSNPDWGVQVEFISCELNP